MISVFQFNLRLNYKFASEKSVTGRNSAAAIAIFQWFKNRKFANEYTQIACLRNKNHSFKKS